MCTPTRCAFIIGRYPQRLDVGLYEPLTVRDMDKGLAPGEPTIAADYFTHGSGDSRGADLWENLAPVERVGYLTDLLPEKAAQFVGRRRSKPFYHFLSANPSCTAWCCLPPIPPYCGIPCERRGNQRSDSASMSLLLVTGVQWRLSKRRVYKGSAYRR